MVRLDMRVSLRSRSQAGGVLTDWKVIRGQVEHLAYSEAKEWKLSLSVDKWWGEAKN